MKCSWEDAVVAVSAVGIVWAFMLCAMEASQLTHNERLEHLKAGHCTDSWGTWSLCK